MNLKSVTCFTLLAGLAHASGPNTVLLSLFEEHIFPAVPLVEKQLDWSELAVKVKDCCTSFLHDKGAAADLACVANALIDFNFDIDIENVTTLKTLLEDLYGGKLSTESPSAIVASFHSLVKRGEWRDVRNLDQKVKIRGVYEQMAPFMEWLLSFDLSRLATCSKLIRAVNYDKLASAIRGMPENAQGIQALMYWYVTSSIDDPRDMTGLPIDMLFIEKVIREHNLEVQKILLEIVPSDMSRTVYAFFLGFYDAFEASPTKGAFLFFKSCGTVKDTETLAIRSENTAMLNALDSIDRRQFVEEEQAYEEEDMRGEH